MSTSPFRDYYKILQVHYDASPEIIRAAYKKLCKSYHPDENHEDSEQMSVLNEAFQVLNHVSSRKAYHCQWLEHYAPQNDYVRSLEEKGTYPNDTSESSAKETMELFFHALHKHDWESAYLLLTDEDKSNTLPEDFTDWREAIELCSSMQSYIISFMRTFHDCRLDQVLYKIVNEFQVEVKELDMLTLEASVNTVRKCAVYDGVSWRIWLGNANIKSAILRFRMMAEKNKNINPMAIYHNAVSRIDSLTGLLSERGFYDDAEREVARTRRYNNPFTLLAFQLHCSSREKETACLFQLSSIIKNGLRTTDIAARLDNNQIICLLTETRKYSGDMAANKFLRLVSEKQSESFQVSFGVVFYNGFNSLKDAVLTACSIADSSAQS